MSKRCIVRLTVVSFVLVILPPWLCGCGTAKPAVEKPVAQEAKPAAPAPEKPRKFDPQALIAREIAPLGKAAIEDQTGRWKAEIEAASEPSYTRSEKYTEVTVSLGTGAPLQCGVHSESIDAAATLLKLLKFAGQKVTFQETGITDVQAIGDTAIVFVRGMYTTEQNGQRLLGELELAFYAGEERTALCVHDELGYRETFHRVALGFFNSIAPLGEGDKSVAPSSAALVYALTVNDTPVGFAREKFVRLDDGTDAHYKFSSMLMPRSAADLVAFDSVTILFSDKKGRVTNGTWIDSEQGTITTRIDLERAKGKKYTFKGRFKGKEVQGEFVTKGPQGLSSDIRAMREISAIRKKGKTAEFTTEEYGPSIDPSAPIEVRYGVQVNEGKADVSIDMGQIRISAATDEQGFFESVDWPVTGSAAVRMKRLSVRGQLR